jgi:hypothetical protein
LAEAVGTAINLLIAGSSHVGKSSLAAELSQALGWPVVSTDSLARHPGRPWPVPPPHVAEFYAQLSDQSIFQFLRHHHDNMRPLLERALPDRIAQGSPCIWEGSALRPDYFAAALGPQTHMICLAAPAAVLRQRMHANSGYDGLPPDHRRLVDRFLTRSLTDNAALTAAAKSQNIDCIDTSDEAAFTLAKTRLIETLRGR